MPGDGAAPAVGVPLAIGLALTGAPGRTRWTPRTISVSPGCKSLHHLDPGRLPLADADHAALDLAVLDQEHDVAQALADHGLLRHHDRVLLVRDLDRHRQEHPGLERFVLVLELGRQPHAAGRRLDAGIDDRDLAVEQPVAEGGGAGAHDLSRLELVEQVLGHGEVETHLGEVVERGDAGARRDVGAERDGARAEASAEGSADDQVLQARLRRPAAGFGGGDGALEAL